MIRKQSAKFQIIKFCLAIDRHQNSILIGENKLSDKPVVALGPNHTVLENEHERTEKTDIQHLTWREDQLWRRWEEIIQSDKSHGTAQPFRRAHCCVTYLFYPY